MFTAIARRFHAHPPPKGRPLRFVCCALLSASSLLIGCESKQPRTQRGDCILEVGMTVADLLRCGCTLSSTFTPTLPPAGTHGSQIVTAVNYFCPLRENRFARVSVYKGTAQEVFFF